MSGSGIRWAICKSAPRSSQIKMPVPHTSVFYRPDALPAAQPTVSKHCRHDRNIPVTTIRTVHEKTTTTIMRRTGECRQDVVDSQKPSFSLADDISGHGDSMLGDSVHGSTSISTSSPNSSSSSSFSRYSGTVSADINTEHERHSFVCRHSKTSKKTSYSIFLR